MTDPHRFPTSLGPPIDVRDGFAVLDLTDLPIFHGLSVLSRSLGELAVSAIRTGHVDVNVERQVRARENPELRRELGITWVRLVGESEAIATLAEHPDVFQDQLRGVLGTIQRARFREALIPSGGEASRALVFDFAEHGGALRHRWLLEYRAPDQPDRGAGLRITVEDPCGRRLDLSSIPHVGVEDLASRRFIAGSTRIAHTWSDGIRRSAEHGHHSFVEIRRPHRHVFVQLDKAGLGPFQDIYIHWRDAESDLVLDSEPGGLEHLLKRVLLALEDREFRRLLGERFVGRIDCGDHRVYVDVSHLGRVLNLSLGAHRERIDVDSFLDRMPALARIADTAEAPLSGIKVFLVHHVTAEVIGLIAALRRLGCRDLTCLFVAYAGEPPPSWLEALLDLPSDEFHALALAHVPDERSVEGRYRLSSRYSILEDEPLFNDALARRGGRYFDAMQVVARGAFARQVRAAEADGQRCLVIEDGGYLAPLLNEACLAGDSVRTFLASVEPDCADGRPLRDVLEPLLIGSVEHTRNGYSRLAEIEARGATLAFPAFSIAISRLKIEDESKEVAVSVLNAVENVLHAAGKILSRRHCLVLGSHGAIGRNLVEHLGRRLADPDRQLTRVDLVAPDEPAQGTTRAFGDLPETHRKDIDLVLGVTGTSVLTGDELREWLVHGTAPELMLASGSTKTEEFTDLMAFVDALLGDAAPAIDGSPCRVERAGLHDPMTGRSFGQRYRLSWGSRVRSIAFLANSTPVNFMFYGVPTELIDDVLAQLVSVSLGLVRRADAGSLAPRLLAVDHEITEHGEDREPGSGTNVSDTFLPVRSPRPEP